MYINERTEVSDLSKEDKKALVQLDSEIFNLYQLARKSRTVLNFLEETYFGADEIEQGGVEAMELCGYYPAMKLQLEMAIDYVHILLTHLETMDELAEQSARADRGGPDDE